MDLKQIVFLIGLYVMIASLVRILAAIKRTFFGTKVFVERYGQDSWAVVTGCTDGIGR